MSFAVVKSEPNNYTCSTSILNLITILLFLIDM